MGPFYLVLVFILLLAVLIVASYYTYQLIILDTPPPNTPNTSVACDESAVLQAWIQNTPNPPICQPFTNNYIISGDGIQMFQKPFVVNNVTNCCSFSNQADAAIYFPNPWICIANNTSNPQPFTLDELNQKPYAFNNNKVVFLVPPCDGINCIGLIWFQNNGANSDYKIFLFNGGDTNLPSLSSTSPPREVGKAPPNFTGATYQDVIFTVSPDCLNLVQVTIFGTVVAQNGQFTVSQSILPPFVISTVELFNQTRFYPIAGANPPLSQSAATSG